MQFVQLMPFVIKGRECCVCLLCLVQVNVEPGGEVVDEGMLLQSGFELLEGLAVEGREAGLADAPGCCYLREGRNSLAVFLSKVCLYTVYAIHLLAQVH